MPELWADQIPPDPRSSLSNKIVLPICGAIILFGVWWLGWLPLDTITGFLWHG